MAGTVNKVILVANLGRDPETRSFPSGGKICNLRVATSKSWKNRDSGEWQERTEWHSVVIRNEHLIKRAEEKLRKGSKIYIEGELQTRKWQDQSGQDKYSTEVVLQPYESKMEILDGKQDGQSGGNGGYGGQSQYAGNNNDLDDSEIPF